MPTYLYIHHYTRQWYHPDISVNFTYKGIKNWVVHALEIEKKSHKPETIIYIRRNESLLFINSQLDFKLDLQHPNSQTAKTQISKGRQLLWKLVTFNILAGVVVVVYNTTNVRPSNLSSIRWAICLQSAEITRNSANDVEKLSPASPITPTTTQPQLHWPGQKHYNKNNFWRHDNTVIYIIQSLKELLGLNGKILDYLGSFGGSHYLFHHRKISHGLS